MFFFSVSNNLESACGSAPCFNGGTCKNVGEGGFSCTCAAHYSGAQCEVKLGKNVKCRNILAMFWAPGQKYLRPHPHLSSVITHRLNMKVC